MGAIVKTAMTHLAIQEALNGKTVGWLEKVSDEHATIRRYGSGFSMRHLWTLFVVLASAAGAAEVGPCNDLDRISSMVGQTRSFSEGKIKIAHVDTDGEPVCCSSHLLVFIPSPEIGSQCFAVSQVAAKAGLSPRGFSNVEFNRIKAAYDPKRGLLLTVPYTLYDPAGGQGKPGTVNVRVNLTGNGSVRIERDQRR